MWHQYEQYLCVHLVEDSELSAGNATMMFTTTQPKCLTSLMKLAEFLTSQL